MKNKIIGLGCVAVPFIIILTTLMMVKTAYTSIINPIIGIQLLIFILVFLWKRFTLFLAITLTTLVNGAAIGLLTVDSMIFGIELFSGKQEGTFLGLPAQNGLLNTQDIMISSLLFLSSIIIISYLTFQRRKMA
ncbi:MAG: hypothetical protein ACRC6X_06280 [Culicoidibacterales bacterium]